MLIKEQPFFLPLPEGGATAIPQPGFGNVSGSIINETGTYFPSNLTVTLRGFDHDAVDPSAGPVEVLTLDAAVKADGTYAFENVEIPVNRIFVAEVDQEEITLQSGFAIVEEGAQSVTMPSLTLYAATKDTSALVMDEVQLIFEYGTDSLQVYGIYSFRNPGSEIIVVPQSESGEISFIQFTKGAFSSGFEPTQDSEPFMPTEDGLAIPPSENAYQLIAFASLTRADEIDFSQRFSLPVSSITIFTPVGVKLENRPPDRSRRRGKAKDGVIVCIPCIEKK